MELLKIVVRYGRGVHRNMVTCEEAITCNRWYCSAITSVGMAYLSWAVTGMMTRRGAARSHVASLRMDRGREVAVNAEDDVNRFLELVHVFATAPRRKHVSGRGSPSSGCND